MTELLSNRPRLLILAHSCNPEYGSEPGVGWNWALQTAKNFQTWILCDEEYNRAAIERYIAQHGAIDHLKFVFVPMGRETMLSRVPATFYLRYNLWHRRALRIAKELHAKMQFDLVHQLNLNGFREPGYLWKLDAPFVWGPVGGAQNYPWRFLTGAGLAGAVSESIRSLLNLWQIRTSRRVGLAARKATALLAPTEVNARAMASRRHAPVRMLLETGVHPLPSPPKHDFKHGGPLRILWSGVFENRKALHLLLEAVAALPKHVEFELQILGRGPLDGRWRKLAKRLNIDGRCKWLGWLDHDQALDRFRWADVFVFSSLRDTSGTVMLESLAAGTPIVCFDHQGAGEIVTPACGIKLPVTTSRAAIRQMSDALLRCYDDREELERLSRGAIQRAEYYAWDRQGRRMTELYHEILGIDDSSVSDSERPMQQVFAETVALGNPLGDA